MYILWLLTHSFENCLSLNGSAAGAGCDMTHNSVPGGAMQPAASTSTMFVGFIPGSSSHESHGGTKGWAFVNHNLGVVFVSWEVLDWAVLDEDFVVPGCVGMLISKTRRSFVRFAKTSCHWACKSEEGGPLHMLCNVQGPNYIILYMHISFQNR